MAQDIAVNQDTVVYCTAEDVATYLLKDKSHFSYENSPTKEQVENIIKAVQDDVDNFTRCSWRERQVAGLWIDVDYNQYNMWGAGFKFNLKKRNIKALDADEGDELLVWDGSRYVDYLTERTEGRSSDFWIDYEDGYLYIRTSAMIYAEKVIKATFRYGKTVVPSSIKKATAQLVAVILMTNEDSSFILAEGGDSRNMPFDPRISRMLASAKQTLLSHSEIFVI